jgi:MoxR-like ATPase
MLNTIDDTLNLLNAGQYVADRPLATVLFLALKMQRPLLLEGEAGVGKTEIAKVLAQQLNLPLIRLQCYEGLDVAQSLYEWNYAKQMLSIKQDKEQNLFGLEFLQKRPLLQALETPCVLLIDELDRTDDAFEAFLLELLSDFQVTIPELGVVKAATKPIVILTSNRTREIHDALKRRCLYHWVNYPSSQRELEILRRKVPQAGEKLSAQVVDFIQRLRTTELYKTPGLAETIDWATALTELDAVALDQELVSDTLGVLLKYQEDLAKIQGAKAKALLDEVKRDVA